MGLAEINCLLLLLLLESLYVALIQLIKFYYHHVLNWYQRIT